MIMYLLTFAELQADPLDPWTLKTFAFGIDSLIAVPSSYTSTELKNFMGWLQRGHPDPLSKYPHPLSNYPDTCKAFAIAYSLLYPDKSLSTELTSWAAHSPYHWTTNIATEGPYGYPITLPGDFRVAVCSPSHQGLTAY